MFRHFRANLHVLIQIIETIMIHDIGDLLHVLQVQLSEL